MKHSIQQLICIVVFLNINTIFSQEMNLETETAFMNCFYQALPDKGAKFKIVLQKAEQKLIEKKILKDGSGESYVTLYKNLNNLIDSETQELGILNYMKEVSTKMNASSHSDCMQLISESPTYEDSKFFKMITAIQTQNLVPEDYSDIAAKILTIITPKDFEHDYYKMSTFTMIEVMNIPVHMESDLPEYTHEEHTAEELERAFKIEMQAAKQLSANGKKIALKDVRKKVITYLQKHKSESVISLKYDLNIEYSFYISVQNEVTQAYKAIRDKVSKEKFNRLFEELTTAQQKEIKKIYPMKIIESE